MENKNLKYFIGLAVLVVAIGVVWAMWPKQNTSVQNTTQEPKNFIPELGAKTMPAVGAVINFDTDSKQLTFSVKDEEYIGTVTNKTLILKQVKDRVGAMSIQAGKASDIAKGAKVMIVPTPTGKGVYDLAEVQIVK